MSERSRSFGQVAELYNRYRPGPPPELAAYLGDLTSARVLEVGAGTGLVTRYLLSLGATVTAIEPDPGMRAVLTRESPGLSVVEGVAESLPVRDASMDVTVVSSAWHWFEQPAATLELARVLVDGGRAFVLGNGLSDRHQWFEDISRIQDPKFGSAGRRHASEADVDLAVAFTDVENFEIDWSWERTDAELLGMFATYSGVILATPEQRAALEERARERLAEFSPTGVTQVPMRLSGVRATRPAR